jgi:hypothetical protein
MAPLVKNLIIGVVVAVLLFVGYRVFLKDNEGEATLSTSTESAVAPIAQNLLGALLTLESLNLDTRLFNDQMFNSLQDFSQPIGEQPIRRNNPFAPLGIESGGAATTTVGAR